MCSVSSAAKPCLPHPFLRSVRAASGGRHKQPGAIGVSSQGVAQLWHVSAWCGRAEQCPSVWHVPVERVPVWSMSLCGVWQSCAVSLGACLRGVCLCGAWQGCGVKLCGAWQGCTVSLGVCPWGMSPGACPRGACLCGAWQSCAVSPGACPWGCVLVGVSLWGMAGLYCVPGGVSLGRGRAWLLPCPPWSVPFFLCWRGVSLLENK